MTWTRRLGATAWTWCSRQLLGASLASLLAYPVAALPMNAQRPNLDNLLRAEVVRVVNGNTLLVSVLDQPTLRERIVQVQLVGIEPPAEVRFGYFAGQYLQDIARGGIFLEIPGGLRTQGVLMGYVWSGNTLINEEMLMLGHGFEQDNAADSRYAQALSEAVTVAQSQGRGIWNYYSPQME